MVQDGDAVHHNAVTQGMVGAALFGLGGAIAGVTAMHKENQVGTIALKLLFEGFNPPSMTIVVLNSMVPKASPAHNKSFQFAQELYGVFEGAVLNNKSKLADNMTESETTKVKFDSNKADIENKEKKIQEDNFEKLRQLAKLQEEGIITKEEYDNKKREILEII